MDPMPHTPQMLQRQTPCLALRVALEVKLAYPYRTPQ